MLVSLVTVPPVGMHTIAVSMSVCLCCRCESTSQQEAQLNARDGRPYCPCRKTNQTIVLSKTQYYYRNEIIQITDCWAIRKK